MTEEKSKLTKDSYAFIQQQFYKQIGNEISRLLSMSQSVSKRLADNLQNAITQDQYGGEKLVKYKELLGKIESDSNIQFNSDDAMLLCDLAVSPNDTVIEDRFDKQHLGIKNNHLFDMFKLIKAEGNLTDTDLEVINEYLLGDLGPVDTEIENMKLNDEISPEDIADIVKMLIERFALEDPLLTLVAVVSLVQAIDETISAYDVNLPASSANIEP